MQLNIFCLLISHSFPRLLAQLKYSASIFKRNNCFLKFQYPIPSAMDGKTQKHDFWDHPKSHGEKEKED